MRNGEVVDLGEVELLEPAPEEPPAPRPAGRRRWQLLAVAVGVVALVAAVTGGKGPEDRSTTPPTTPSPSTPPPDVQFVVPRGLDETLLIGAPAGYEATGSLATLDLERRAVRQRLHDVRLWPGDFEVPMLTVAGHLVWADLEHAWSVPIDLHREPVIIGDASYIIPASDRSHVWLVQQNPIRVTEVGPDGDVRRPTVALPANTRPVAGVDAGIVAETNRGAALLDDQTGEILRMFWNRTVFTAFGTTALTHGLELLDLSTGESAVITDHSTGGRPVSAVFSPDGRFVAILDQQESMPVAIIEVRVVADGTLVQRNEITSGTVVWNSLVWSPQSDALYVLTSRTVGSADRVVGIPLGGLAQTVAHLDDEGWYWLAVS